MYLWYWYDGTIPFLDLIQQVILSRKKKKKKMEGSQGIYVLMLHPWSSKLNSWAMAEEWAANDVVCVWSTTLYFYF